MNDTIKSLYKGTVFPAEQCGMNNNEIKELTKSLSVVFSKLKELIPANCFDLLDSFETLSINLNILYNEEFFAEGFKLGIKLATESLCS